MPDKTNNPSLVPSNIPSCFTSTHGVITATTNTLPGYRITKTLGTVYGITVRARNWGADISSILRSAVGGELRTFTKLLYTGRNEALERLVGECMGRGGNAVLAVRFDVVAMGVCVQICAYGTACVVEESRGGGGERQEQEEEKEEGQQVQKGQAGSGSGGREVIRELGELTS